MKEKLKNKKFVYTIIGIISLLLVVIAVTYAYWLVTESQEGENVVTSACLDISLNGKNDITLSNQFPITDEDGKKLTPYEFTITNNCNTSVDYQVALEALGEESSAMSASALKVMLNEDTPVLLSSNKELDPTISGAYTSYKLATGTLAEKNAKATYTIRLWIDEDAPISEMNKTFRSKISVTIGQGIKAIPANPYTEGTLAYSIYDNAVKGDYYQSDAPDFSKNVAEGEYGLYNAQDNDGTSYYFRGDAENNYVTIQYEGTKTVEKTVWTIDGSVDAWGSFETEAACQSQLESYVEAGAPVTSCGEVTVTEEVDGIIADSWRIVRINGDDSIRLIYAGDLGFESDCSGGWCPNEYYNKEVTAPWYDSIETILADSKFCSDTSFEAYKRFGTNPTPILTCNSDFEYTGVGLYEGNSYGSADPRALTGFLSADEAFFAGAYKSGNHYLNFGSVYWLGTAYSDTDNEAQMPGDQYIISSTGYLTTDLSGYRHEYRLVINIKADTAFTGTGSSLNPYVVSVVETN